MTDPRDDNRALRPDDQRAIEALYHELLACWNRRDPRQYAALFTPESHLVGFDGSMVDSAAAIEEHLRQIFGDHVTAAYVGKVRGVESIAPDAALLRAVVGMVPPGQTDLNPAANAVQSLVVVKRDGQWRIAHFQNTPAAFHGRPEASEQLTQELREVLRASQRSVAD